MIRPGEYADIPALTEIALEFWQHTIYPFPGEGESLSGFIQHCIDLNLLCVLEIDGTIEGFAAGVKGPCMGDNTKVCGSEAGWWVNPEHRGGKYGIALLQKLESMAKDAGVEYWTMVYMETSMPEKIQSIYEKLGYKRAEVTYMKEL